MSKHFGAGRLEQSKQVLEAYLTAAEQQVDEGLSEPRGFTAYYDDSIWVKVIADQQSFLWYTSDMKLDAVLEYLRHRSSGFDIPSENSYTALRH